MKFSILIPTPDFPFLLYVRWKSGVTSVRRCFRDVHFFHSEISNHMSTRFSCHLNVWSLKTGLTVHTMTFAYAQNRFSLDNIMYFEISSLKKLIN